VQLEKDYARFKEHGAELVAIAFQNQNGATRSAEKSKVSYPILADKDHEVASAYNVHNLLKDGVATPAVFIIDSSGEIAWSYIGKNLGDRPSTQVIFEYLPSLK